MDREVIARRLYEAWCAAGMNPAMYPVWDSTDMEKIRPRWRMIADEALALTHRETLERVEHDLRLVNAKLELLHGLVERKRTVLC